MISKEAHEFLHEEKKRTGDTLPVIVERALMHLKKTGSGLPAKKLKDRKSPEKPENEKPSPSSKNTLSDEEKYRNAVIDQILHLRDIDRLSFGEIARRLNGQNLKTFSGIGVWHDRIVSMVYHRHVK